MLLMSYTEIADLLTEKWVEILGWISIPAIATALIVGIIKIITTCINKKISKSSLNEVNAKIEGVVNQVNSTLKEMKEFYDNGLDNYTSIVETKVNSVLDKYEETKKVAYQRIMDLNSELNEKVGELKEKTIEATEKAEEIVDNKVEELEDKAEEVVEQAKEVVEQAKEVVEEKVEKVKDIIENIER